MKTETIKLIAFDFDGVIVDSLRHNMQITNNACRQYGSLKDVTEKDLQQINQMSFDAVAEFIGVPRENFKPCLELINKQLVETYDALLPFPRIKEVLSKLADAGLTLIIVTHNTQYAVNAFLEKYDMASCFSLVLGAETPGEKDIKLTNGLKKLNIEPENAIMIGDSVGDIQNSIAAKVTPFGVAWGFQNAGKLSQAGAVEILQTPEDIAKFANKKVMKKSSAYICY